MFTSKIEVLTETELQMLLRNSTNILFKTLATLSNSPVRNLSAVVDRLINVEVNDKTGIAYVTLNRKPVNGINLELFEALSKTLDDLERNKTLAMILTSVS